MKAYCTTCKDKKPASFRKFIRTDCRGDYEDLCCDERHTILATIEERDGEVARKVGAGKTACKPMTMAEMVHAAKHDNSFARARP